VTLDAPNKSSLIHISSGMSVSAEIKTGQRRIIDFFIDPLATKVEDGLKVR